MKACITEVRPASTGEWDDHFRRCAHATYFHSRQWAEVWQEYTGGWLAPAARVLAFADGNVAVLPLSVRRRFRGLDCQYVSSPGGTYGGWLSGDELGDGHWTALNDYLCRRVGSVAWRVNPYAPPIACGRGAGVEADQTYAVRLADGFDAVRRRCARGHLSAANKAQRHGVVIRAADTIEQWRAYYAVYQDSLRRWGQQATSRHDWPLFEGICRRSSPHVRLWLAEHDSKVVSGALCFYAGRHAVYWHGATLEAYFSLRPATLLMLRAIEDACQRGCAWFDFNPSGGHEGVTVFKQRFGAEALACPIVTVESRGAKLLGAISNLRLGRVARRRDARPMRPACALPAE